jgi:hypothetical protein
MPDNALLEVEVEWIALAGDIGMSLAFSVECRCSSHVARFRRGSEKFALGPPS